METFYNITRLLTVADIAQPIFATFQIDDAPGDVWEEFMEGRDPFDHIGLVMDDGNPVGWTACDMLDHELTRIEACMDRITSGCIIASTTPLIESLGLFDQDVEKTIYFVLTNTGITHFLNYSHFTRPPFVACLLVLVIGLEQLMLEICKAEPMHWVANLSEGRLRKATEVYEMRGFPQSEDGKWYADRVIECTTLIDKFEILRKDSKVREISPAVTFGATRIEGLRNWAAHPTREPLPSASDLVPLIDTIETLYAQLEEVRAQCPLYPLRSP